MTDKEQPPSIAEQIDADEGLKSKRKMLVVVSLILLALLFSGAKVEEANTFILKISFDNQHGISLLLVLSVIFLLIRYHNYASKYRDLLYKLWSNRLIAHPFFLRANEDGSKLFGLIVDIAPPGFVPEPHSDNDQHSGFAYKCQFPLIRKISYWAENQYPNYESEARVGWRNYLSVLRLEAQYRVNALFSHREHLDILAPYALGMLAIVSYFFNAELQSVLGMLTVR